MKSQLPLRMMLLTISDNYPSQSRFAPIASSSWFGISSLSGDKANMSNVPSTALKANRPLKMTAVGNAGPAAKAIQVQTSGNNRKIAPCARDADSKTVLMLVRLEPGRGGTR